MVIYSKYVHNFQPNFQSHSTEIHTREIPDLKRKT